MSGNKLRSIYTDGGCNNAGQNKSLPYGIGSWAYVEQISDNIVKVRGAKVYSTTNNRTEMMAVLNGIRSFEVGSRVRVYTDSGYIYKGWNDPSYLAKWMVNGWMTSNRKPVENKDLWEQFLELRRLYDFQLVLIKGHGKNHNSVHNLWNNVVDDACTWLMRNHEAIPDDTHTLIYDMMSGKGRLIGTEEVGEWTEG